MKKHFVFVALAMLALCGCSSLPSEELSPAGITVEELEKRMAEATDPHGRYKNARSFVMKQEVERRSFFDDPMVQMVETKIMRPNFFKITTYEDNQPVTAVISNGESSWQVDYKAEKVRMLDAEKMRQVRKFNDISSPSGKWSRIFKDVTVQKCRIGDDLFYKIACPGEKDTVLNAYVGFESCQIERITVVTDGKLTYDSSLKGYGLYEGVRIPEETVVKSGGSEQLFKVIYCKIDPPLEASEFRPPVF